MKNNDLLLKDRFSMALLIFLYTLQGIPIGLSASIPLLLKEKGVGYEALSLFSMVSIPFSFKIFWAPLVDAYYFTSVGKRKTWLIPTQLVTGFLLLYGSFLMKSWLSSPDQNIFSLTVYFLFLYFLMATQDIAVDGWALTMLSKESVSYAAFCNTVGQALGVFLANHVFVALSDPFFCFKYLGLQEGFAIVDLSGFMNFWAFVFIVSTFLVWIFKSEEISSSEEEDTFLGVVQKTYGVLKLPNTFTIILILLTCRVATAPLDCAYTFKLQESGMPKADIAKYSPILFISALILPLFVSHYVTKHPISCFMQGLLGKLIIVPFFWLLLHYTAKVYSTKQDPPLQYHLTYLSLSIINELLGSFSFLAIMSFFSKISDPTFGGTYMTLFNTINNLGSKWPCVFTLYILPKCDALAVYFNINYISYEICPMDKDVCLNVKFDGYYLLSIFCFIFGIFFLFFNSRKMEFLALGLSKQQENQK